MAHEGMLDFMRGEPAALVRDLVPLESAHASSQILRLSYALRMCFLLRTLPPDVTRNIAEEHDAMDDEIGTSIDYRRRSNRRDGHRDT